MKVLIGTDIEGVAGVVSRPVQTSADGKYYEAAKKLKANTWFLDGHAAGLGRDQMKEIPFSRYFIYQ